MQLQQTGTPINLADSGIVSNAAGSLLGFYVNSTGSGVIKIYNGTSTAGTALSGSITPAIGWRAWPAYFPSGCFIELVSGTINITAMFAAG